MNNGYCTTNYIPTQTKGGSMEKEKIKISLEMLIAYLGVEGPTRETGNNACFACPICKGKNQAIDSTNDHLVFRKRDGLITCYTGYVRGKNKLNDHGIKIYNEIKAEMERIKNGNNN